MVYLLNLNHSTNFLLLLAGPSLTGPEELSDTQVFPSFISLAAKK
jgi:hypothetical protein